MIFALLYIAGCSNATDEPAKDGSIKIYLVDTPGEFEQVNVAITRVEVHRAGADTVSGWTVVNNTPAVYDLLKLRNGASAILGHTTLSPGKYTQIRLLIGTGSHVFVDGQQWNLFIPSGIQTGIKLIHQFTIEADKLYELMLDFDANRSIVSVPGQYILRPTIRVQANVVSGTISGQVLPIDANAAVSTIVATDTVATLADTSGFFKLMALPEGTYSLRINPSNQIYRDTTITGVTVVRKQETNIGTVTLYPN